MKSKKNIRQLTLNKKTIASLNNGKLKNIPGGNGDTCVGNTCAVCTITYAGQHTCPVTCLDPNPPTLVNC